MVDMVMQFLQFRLQRALFLSKQHPKDHNAFSVGLPSATSRQRKCKRISKVVHYTSTQRKDPRFSNKIPGRETPHSSG